MYGSYSQLYELKRRVNLSYKIKAFFYLFIVDFLSLDSIFVYQHFFEA